MKYKCIFHVALPILASFIHLNSMAQKTIDDKLMGCWELDKFEFVQHNDDSADFVNQAKNYISCFEKGGKFTTSQKNGKALNVIGTGTYKIADDGKTIYQKRDIEDNGEDEPAEIIVLDEKAFVVKSGDAIVHFKRMK